MKSVVYHLLTESEPFSEPIGGAISRWAANVLRGDEDSVVICPSADDTWGFARERVRCLPPYSRYNGVRRVAMHSPWFLHKKFLETMLGPGLAGLKAGDVVWVHNRPDYAVAIEPIVHGAKARLVLHMHNSHLVQWSEKITRALRVDQTVFVSKFLQQEAQAKFPEMKHVTVLYNGADASMFYSDDRGSRNGNHTPLILFASRLVRDKGPQVFLEAMRQLENRKIQVKGMIVGSSKFGGSKLTGFVKELHRTAPQNVEFHPYCSGRPLADLFRQADIFCLPSVWNDPFPLAPLEAMASKLPVVATQSGGIPEAFEEGGALLVGRGSANELAAAIERLVSEPSLRNKLAEDGYASFHKNFTWVAVRQRYHEVLDSLTA
jgi:spore coat protein SA